MENLKQIQKYLSVISEDKFEVVIMHMTGAIHPNTKDGGDCSCPSTGSTPNGHWVCNNGTCVWIPEIG